MNKLFLVLVIAIFLGLGSTAFAVVNPDINILQPTYQYYSYLTSDGTDTIDFNISDIDNNYLYVDIYYSDTSDINTVIIQDFNLIYYGNPANATAAMGCDDNDFKNSTYCWYDFNYFTISPRGQHDGNYYIDINAWTNTYYSNTESSTAFNLIGPPFNPLLGTTGCNFMTAFVLGLFLIVLIAAGLIITLMSAIGGDLKTAVLGMLVLVIGAVIMIAIINAMCG